MEEFRFTYLFMVAGTALIWLTIFLANKDLRKEMALMSCLVAVLGMTQASYVGEYWTPVYAFPIPNFNFGPEDIGLAFFFYGGIGSVLYQSLSKQTYICPITPHMDAKLIHAFVPPCLGAAVIFTLELFTPLNVIYSSSIGLLVAASYLWVFRQELRSLIVFNGLCFALLAIAGLIVTDLIFSGYINHTWNVGSLSGYRIASIPIEEFIFHFSAGAAFAVAYEALYGCRLLSKS